ncbi:hypothetical protein PR048_020185 [Dryococelus australis]|uniref:Uncharacterized protein n=1 Tax=Dryococelus australis TaxID=614101 RepID=A0ABQ9H5L2_9NEOP|nr:hypothetical protein PR048_020185 [Dryococelus australis]
MKRGQQNLLSFYKKPKNSAAESLVPTRSFSSIGNDIDLTEVKSSLPCSHPNDIGSYISVTKLLNNGEKINALRNVWNPDFK